MPVNAPTTQRAQASPQAAPPARAPATATAANPRQAQAQSDYLRSLRPGQGGQSAVESEGTVAVETQAATGLESYEATLGKYLGSKLYKAVSEQVSADKMTGFAQKALDGAIGYVTGQIGDLAGAGADPKALTMFSSALDVTLSPYVDAFMTSGPGKDLQTSLADWVDSHPREVATLAILAAIGMVLANAEIPALKSKFKIANGVSASVEAKLGRFQKISLEQIKARIEAEGRMFDGTVKAAVEVESKQRQDGTGRDTTAAAELAWQNDAKTWKAGGRYGYSAQGHSAEAFVRREDPKKSWFVEGKVGHSPQMGNYAGVGVGFRF